MSRYRTRDGYKRPRVTGGAGPLPAALVPSARDAAERALRQAEAIGDERTAEKARRILAELPPAGAQTDAPPAPLPCRVPTREEQLAFAAAFPEYATRRRTP